MSWLKRTIAFLLCISFLGIHAQDTIKVTEQKKYKNNILPTPSFSYSPETGVFLGLFALYQFKPKKAGADTRSSYANAYIGASTLGQTQFRVKYSYYSPGEKWYLEGLISLKHFPEPYFGIGPQSNINDLLILDFKNTDVDLKFYKGIGSHGLFAGPLLKYANIGDVVFKDTAENVVDTVNIRGNEGGYYTGIGAGFLIDKRNSVLRPTGDHYLELASHFYIKGFGSSYSFFTVLLDGRKYFDLRKDTKHILAFQAKMNIGIGQVPFNYLGKIGGNRIMRGHLEGRYRDLFVYQLQAEYRVTLIGRLGAAGFASVGNALPTFNYFDSNGLKWAIGAGLRFNINRKDPANIRLDFGYSPETTGVYITFGEAF